MAESGGGELRKRNVAVGKAKVELRVDSENDGDNEGGGGGGGAENETENEADTLRTPEKQHGNEVRRTKQASQKKYVPFFKNQKIKNH